MKAECAVSKAVEGGRWLAGAAALAVCSGAVVLLALICIALTITLSGCKDDVTTQWTIGCDTSLSVSDAELMRCLQAFNATGFCLIAPRAPFSLMEFASDVELRYEGPRPQRRVLAAMEEVIWRKDRPRARGTFPHLVLDAACASAHPGRPVAVVLLSDGGFDDWPELIASAKRLAERGDGLACIWILPIRQQFRVEMQHKLAFLNDKLVTSTPDDVDQQCSRVCGLVSSAEEHCRDAQRQTLPTARANAKEANLL